MLIVFYLYRCRCLAISKPLSSFEWRTTKKAKAVIFGVYVFATFYGSLYAYTTNFSGPRVCVAVGKKDKLTEFLSWFMLLVNSVFPFISILIMNIIILVAMGRRPTKELSSKETSADTCSFSNVSESQTEVEGKDNPVVHMDQPNSKDGTESTANSMRHKTPAVATISRSTIRRKSSRNRASKARNENMQLAVMLLSVSFAFLILTLPLSVRSVFYALGFFSAASNKEHAQTALVVAITSRLMTVNSAINFWLYSLSGRRFRQDLKQLVSTCLCRK